MCLQTRRCLISSRLDTQAKTVESRIAQLSSHTGIPLAFECYFAAEVENAGKLERTLHQLFADERINRRREFFRVDAEKVVLAIGIGPFTEVTPGHSELDSEDEEAIKRVKSRRSRLRLDALGINPGCELLFSRDESISATVVEGGKVELEGEVLSLSAAALRLLQNMGYKSQAASGSDYWVFDGELLDERRRRMEEEQFGEAASS
jgi:Meiotically up-regulated gene 113